MLLGWQDEGEFRFHGQKKDKALRVEHQQQGLYVELRQTRRKLGVPVSEPDRYALGMLVLDARTRNEPGLGAAEVLAVARGVRQRAGSA
jgi:hypothetical protein